MQANVQGRIVVSTSNTRLISIANLRRSQRLLVSVPIRVTGKLPNGVAFAEHTSTLVVNAHGALIMLKEAVQSGQVVTVQNVATEDEIDCTVIDVNSGPDGIAEIGLEFQRASPKFWHVSFPPADWSPRNPEAKHFAHDHFASLPGNPGSIKK
jgi:hypothetical protein